MERRVIVDAALIRVGAKRKEQAENVVDVRPPGRSRRVAHATQRGDERREAVTGRSIRVGADLQQRADEGKRTVIDRVNQAIPDSNRHLPVRYCGGVIDCRSQSCQVALAESVVYPLEAFRLCATFFFSHSITSHARNGPAWLSL